MAVNNKYLKHYLTLLKLIVYSNSPCYDELQGWDGWDIRDISGYLNPDLSDLQNCYTDPDPDFTDIQNYDIQTKFEYPHISGSGFF